jgi:hypothetical protein
MALTNVPSDPAACGQRFTPSSPAFFWDFRRHKREFSRESPDRRVFLALDVLHDALLDALHDALLDALLDVLLVAIGVTSSTPPRANRPRATPWPLLVASGMSGGICGPPGPLRTVVLGEGRIKAPALTCVLDSL